MSFLLTVNNTQVRIGALKHLANFLSLLSEETRVAYLPRLEEFLKMDNERNWRWFRAMRKNIYVHSVRHSLQYT